MYIVCALCATTITFQGPYQLPILQVDNVLVLLLLDLPMHRRLVRFIFLNATACFLSVVIALCDVVYVSFLFVGYLTNK